MFSMELERCFLKENISWRLEQYLPSNTERMKVDDEKGCSSLGGKKFREGISNLIRIPAA